MKQKTGGCGSRCRSMRKRLFRCRNHGMECPDVARRDAEKALLRCGKDSANVLYVLFRHAKRAFRQCHTGSFAVWRQRFYKGEWCKPLCVNVMRKVLKMAFSRPKCCPDANNRLFSRYGIFLCIPRCLVLHIYAFPFTPYPLLWVAVPLCVTVLRL